MKDLYRTIRDRTEGQFKDRGSRFIALAYPVQKEDQIKKILSGLKKDYHDARHHCYAWRLGADLERYRVNDDGEPSGSAGRPIYGQIQSRDLTDVLVVVVRYFGGTLLGVPGLIQAYRGATAEALEKAHIMEKKVEDRIRVRFDYTSMNTVMKMVKDLDISLEDQVFDQNCELTLRVWKRLSVRVQERLTHIEGLNYELL
jgi:uncharacterized YigZ family protein